PGWAHRLATFGHEPPHIGTLVVHDKDLWRATAVRDKRKVPPSLGIPSWRDIDAAAVGQPLEVAAANVRHINFRILRLAGRKSDSPSVRSPCGCRSQATEGWEAQQTVVDE